MNPGLCLEIPGYLYQYGSRMKVKQKERILTMKKAHCKSTYVEDLSCNSFSGHAKRLGAPKMLSSKLVGSVEGVAFVW